MAIDTAEAAYAAIAELSEATGGIRDLPLPPGEFGRLSDAAKAGRDWLAAHPAEARAYRVRTCMSRLHYALQRIANTPDASERITLHMLGQDAADDLAGEFRDWIQAERDALADADRQRRLQEEQQMAALPRRPDADLVRRMSA